MLTYDEPLIMSSQPALSAATCRYPRGWLLNAKGSTRVDDIAVLSFLFLFCLSLFFKPFSGNFDLRFFILVADCMR